MIAKYLYQSIIWKGLLQASVFILNIAIARHFEASVSGNIFYLVNLYSFILLVASLSMESGIIYFGAKNEIAIGRLYSFSVFYSIVTGLVLWALVHVFYAGTFNGIENKLITVSLVTFVTGNMLTSFGNSFFNARKNFAWPAAIALCVNILLIAIIPYRGGVVTGFLSDLQYFYIFFYGFLLLGILTAFVFWMKYIRVMHFSFPSNAGLKKLLSYSFLALGANIVFFLLYRIDYFFVEKYCSSQDLGNYIQVSKIGQLFFLLPTIFASVVFPVTAGGNRREMFRWLAILSRLFLAFYIVICILFIVTGRWLFPLVFGQSFQHMYAAFVWLVPGILALSVLYSISAYNAGVNKIKFNIIGSLIALAVIVTGNCLAIPFYSINAAACVSSIGYISLLIYLMTIFKKENKVRLRDFFILKPGDIGALKKFITMSKKQ